MSKQKKEKLFIAMIIISILLIINENLLEEQQSKKRQREIWFEKWVKKREEIGLYYSLFKELQLKDQGNFRKCVFKVSPIMLWIVSYERIKAVVKQQILMLQILHR